MDEAEVSDISTHDTYGSFLRDLQDSELEILPNEEIVEKVKVIRDESTPDELKAHLRNDIIESNMRLIPHILKHSAKKIGVRPEELIGESFEVLNKCIDNWDPFKISTKSEEPVKFVTYFGASLRASLRFPHSVAVVGKPIVLPQGIRNLENYMRQARELFMQEEKREPNYDEWYMRTVDLAASKRIKAINSLTPENFDNIERTTVRGIGSLEKLSGSGTADPDTLTPNQGFASETIADDDADTEEEALRELLKTDVQNALNILSPVERTVIELRFGIGFNEDGKPRVSQTLENVGGMIGKTRERVRQIESKALRKLRVSQKNDNTLKSYVIEDQFGDKRVNPFTE